jgi:hypothetical protein
MSRIVDKDSVAFAESFSNLSRFGSISIAPVSGCEGPVVSASNHAENVEVEDRVSVAVIIYYERFDHTVFHT